MRKLGFQNVIDSLKSVIELREEQGATMSLEKGSTVPFVVPYRKSAAFSARLSQVIPGITWSYSQCKRALFGTGDWGRRGWSSVNSASCEQLMNGAPSGV